MCDFDSLPPISLLTVDVVFLLTITAIFLVCNQNKLSAFTLMHFAAAADKATPTENPDMGYFGGK